jgi:hypothetical protein
VPATEPGRETPAPKRTRAVALLLNPKALLATTAMLAALDTKIPPFKGH